MSTPTFCCLVEGWYLFSDISSFFALCRTSSSEAQASQPVPGSSTTESSGSQEQSGVPEGLDPSFLAALPENIRAEVIADHLRMQRIQQRRQEQQNTETPGGLEVNAEFLAALPPAIQEEVVYIIMITLILVYKLKILLSPNYVGLPLKIEV